MQIGVGFALTVLSIRLTPVIAAEIDWRWTFSMLVPGPAVGALAMLLLAGRTPRSSATASSSDQTMLAK